MGDVQWVNYSPIIAQNSKVTAINSCIEVDLTGQVAADSIGTRMYSGFGGQVDFLRGAAICPEAGKPILALPATTKRSESKIIPVLKGVIFLECYFPLIFSDSSIGKKHKKKLTQNPTSSKSTLSYTFMVFS